MAEKSLLDAIELTCERDDRVLFSGLNLSVRAGEVWQIEGANGAGKTTLLRILAGLLPPLEGRLLWRGRSLAEVAPEFAASLVYLGHRTGIKANLSPLENLRVWCGLRGSVDESRLRQALAIVRLRGYETVPCHQLSAGQQRRAALARLHVGNFPLWILDEAFTAIDRQGVQELERLIADHAATGGAVVLTTHHVLSDFAGLHRLPLVGPRRARGEAA